MFFSENVLTRKGPLANIWLAAHWDRKLTKAQIVQTDLERSVDEIVQGGLPPMALRLSGQLLLGASRIYWRKARYLLEDCSETLDRIKLNFKLDAQVDMPQNQARAAAGTITLATTSAVNASTLLPEPELDLDEILNMVSTQQHTVGNKENINLKEKFNLNKTFGFEKDLAFVANDPLLQAFPNEIEAGRRLTTDSTGMNMSRESNPFLAKDSPLAYRDDGLATGRMSIEAGRRDASLGMNESLSFSPMRLSVGGKSDFGQLSVAADENPLVNDGEAGFGGDWEVQGQIGQEVNGAYPELPFNTPPRPTAAVKAAPKGTRKRKAVLDDVTELSSAVIQKQVKDTSDIVTASAVASNMDDVHNAVISTITEESRRASLSVNAGIAAVLLSRPGFESDLVMDAFGTLFQQPAAVIQPQPETPVRTLSKPYAATPMDMTPSMPPLTPLPIGLNNLQTPLMNDDSGFNVMADDVLPFDSIITATSAATSAIDIMAACSTSATSVIFQSLVYNQSRSVVAKTFFEVLALSSRGQLVPEQSEAYGAIAMKNILSVA